MKKNSEAASPSAMKHDQYKEEEYEDLISKLPDDILISIISRLTLKEAAITSILSTRWRHLCNYITCLRFQVDIPRKQMKNYFHLGFLFDIGWLNKFLDNYKGDYSLQEFKLRIPGLFGVDIDKWCEFALSRKVEILEIELYFYLTDHAFSVEPLIQDKCGHGLPGLTTLKTLSLCQVNVDDRGVEILLSNCSVLESLSIRNARELKNVAVVGRSNLKHLNIEGSDLQSIHIRDMINLLSFKHRGRKINLVVENVPKLIEIDAQDNTCTTFFQLFDELSCCVHQLLKVTLRIDSVTPLCVVEGSQVLPALINLKHLVLEIDMSREYRQRFPLFHKLIDDFALYISKSACKLEQVHVQIQGITPKAATKLWMQWHRLYNFKMEMRSLNSTNRV